MSIKIEASYSKGEPCFLCGGYATFIVESDRIAVVFYTCGKFECRQEAVKELKKNLKLVEDDVQPVKEKRGRDEEVPWQLSGFDYDRLTDLPTEKLESLCVERDLAKSGTKGQRAQRLLEWKKNGFSAPKKHSKKEEEVQYCIAELKEGGRCGAKCKYYSSYCGRHFQ